jgi:polar amino acid transport system substrate-binding protein
MNSRSGRIVRRLVALLPLLAPGLSTGAAASEPATSTWEQILQSKTLRLCAASGEPWYFKDISGSDAPGAVKVGDVTWRGVGPNLAASVAKAMNVQLEIVEVTWGNAVAALQANQCDFMFVLDPTPERALAIEFVSAPLLWYPIAGLARPDFKLHEWAEVNDPKVRVGVVLGSSTDLTVTRLAPKATIMRYTGSGDMLAAWQSNRVDIAITAAPIVDLALGRLKGGMSVVLKPAVAVPGGTGVRQEQDRRWSSYLSTVSAYYYNTGTTQRFYDEFMTFRGLDPAKATSIQRENW